MSGFVDRENEIFDTLQAFIDAGLEFVVVGGYGVSAYQHRFSVDADLVIQEERLEEFTAILEERGFRSVADKELDVYDGRYLAFEKDRELPVTIDLLVNSLECRQTGGAWSYEYLRQNSSKQEISGTQQTVECLVPDPAVLMAVKLHSGRDTDARDVVGLADDTEIQRVGEHLDRGDPEKRQKMLEQVFETIEDPDFEDSFKGVFSQSEFPESNIEKVRDFINQQRHE